LQNKFYIILGGSFRFSLRDDKDGWQKQKKRIRLYMLGEEHLFSELYHRSISGSNYDTYV